MGGLIVASKFDELPIQCFDAPVEIAPFLPHLGNQSPDLAVRHEVRIGELHVHDMLELAATLRYGRSAFEKNGAQLIGQVRARTNQPRANPVQRLDVKLLLRLQLNKAHCRARSGLGDG